MSMKSGAQDYFKLLEKQDNGQIVGSVKFYLHDELNKLRAVLFDIERRITSLENKSKK